MPRTYVIGDVHGCIDELRELVGLLNLTSTDRLIFIGDLIDRGPNSVEVVRQVTRWSKEMEVKLILGNHEEKFLRYLKHVQEGSGNEKKMTGIEEFPALHHALNDSEIEFLHQSYFSLYLPEYNVMLVHGGLWGNMHFPMPKTYTYDSVHSKFGKDLILLTKVRYLNSLGKFVSLGSENAQDQFWAEQYNGDYGHVYFGHQPFFGTSPKQYRFATGVDIACVYGGCLIAVELGKGEVNYVSVAAKKKYVIV